MSVTNLRSLPRSQPVLERDYWLEHCAGFRVDGSHGRIGVVEEVQRVAGGDSLLVIRMGLLGRRVVTISIREVFEIVPRVRRLWLRTPEAASRRMPRSTPEPLEETRVPVAA